MNMLVSEPYHLPGSKRLSNADDSKVGADAGAE